MTVRIMLYLDFIWFILQTFNSASKLFRVQPTAISNTHIYRY